MTADQPSGRRLPIGLMVVGSEMASFTVVGLLLDCALGTMPGCTIGLTLLGLVVSFYHLVKMSRALSAKKPPASGRSRESGEMEPPAGEGGP